jgi:hypothetical protein
VWKANINRGILLNLESLGEGGVVVDGGIGLCTNIVQLTVTKNIKK